MIFNGSNVKVINENGYLSKYLRKKAPYFPFTKEDVKNNVLLLINNTVTHSEIYYLIAYNNNIAYFIGFSTKGVGILSFNFSTMLIGVIEYKWE